MIVCRLVNVHGSFDAWVSADSSMATARLAAAIGFSTI